MSGSEGTLGQTGESPTPKPSQPCAVTFPSSGPRLGCKWRREPLTQAGVLTDPGLTDPYRAALLAEAVWHAWGWGDCGIMPRAPHKMRCNSGAFLQQRLIRHLLSAGHCSPESEQDLCFNWRLIINKLTHNIISRREK